MRRPYGASGEELERDLYSARGRRSSEPAKAVSAPPTYRNPPLGTVIEAKVC